MSQQELRDDTARLIKFFRLESSSGFLSIMGSGFFTKAQWKRNDGDVEPRDDMLGSNRLTSFF